MDLSTIIGLIFGFGMMIGAFVMEGGNFTSLLVLTAGMIVFGGTIGAVVISFTMEELKTLPSFFKMIFTETHIDFLGTVEQLVETADKARREGLLSLESALAEMDNQFLRRGLQLVIDGTDPELTRSMLEMEIGAAEARLKVGVEIFAAAGGYSPTMGIIGTVMGLVHVLGNLSDPSNLGPAIAVAFVATLYGVSFANLCWLPFSNKIKVKSMRDAAIMEMILEGILSIQAGENPRVIKEKLMTFVPEDAKVAQTSEKEAEER
ncbi:MAG: flagellar motor protein [Solirubrobacterales bacterium]